MISVFVISIILVVSADQKVWSAASISSGDKASFSTKTSPATVNLASACSFGVLAASTITNTGATHISSVVGAGANLGLSPGTAVTGFPPGTFTGVGHMADTTSLQAQLDLTAAYNDAASRSGAITVAGDIGGQTLVAGVYNSASSLAISSANLMLDAQGDPTSVWIFQIGSTLVMTVGLQVVLVNGAQAGNVFWQVGSSATLGANTVIQGTVMAYASITLVTGATVNGRALALNAAVTMDTNAVNVPACATVSVAPPVCTTNCAIGVSPTAVNLNSACSFGVLGGATVTNTGATRISGNLGLSPGTSITGFPPGTFTGAEHIADAVAAQAKADFITAYNDAASRTGAVTLAGNIGGQTLAPGVYNSASSLAISAGDLVLDGQGNVNAVWIFQMGSTLVTTSGRQVLLIGGAQSKNVFWQVGSSATLGTNSVMQGTIMAYASITITTGAILNGQAFANTAAVTMDTNNVNVPGCSSSAPAPCSRRAHPVPEPMEWVDIHVPPPLIAYVAPASLPLLTPGPLCFASQLLSPMGLLQRIWRPCAASGFLLLLPLPTLVRR
jgi:hypothetical protein